MKLSEYNELLKIKNDFVSAFAEKKMIMRFRSWPSGPGGMIKEYNLVNETDVIANLNKELSDMQVYNSELFKSNERLQDALGKKKWYEYVSKRKWCELLPMK